MLSRISVVLSLAARSSASSRSRSSAALRAVISLVTLAKPLSSPIIVPQGRDQHVGPERRAVLADPKAFLLVAALGRRDAQLLFGVAALYVLVGVEDREVLPDDLLGLIALDALGPFVPGGDIALGVEHEDGVVLDALDQEAGSAPRSGGGSPGSA